MRARDGLPGEQSRPRQGQRDKHWEKGKYLLMTHLILIQLVLLVYCSGCGESDKQKNPSGAGMLQPKNSERRYLLPPCAAWSSSSAEHTDTAFKHPFQTQDPSLAPVGLPKMRGDPSAPPLPPLCAIPPLALTWLHPGPHPCTLYISEMPQDGLCQYIFMWFRYKSEQQNMMSALFL